MIPYRKTVWASSLCLFIAGCGGGNGSSADSGPGNAATQAVLLRGQVHGGQSPVASSTVTLYTVNPGAAATVVTTAQTDGNGNFNLSFTCSSGGLSNSSLLYVTSTGGNPGGGTNTALSELLALGPCGSLPASANIDEVTTVAAAYALSGFITVSGTAPNLSVNVQTSSANTATGLANAFTTATTLANPVTGQTPAALASSQSTAEQTINTLANSVAACVNTAGASSGQCQELFQCALPSASFSSGTSSCSGGSGTAPRDTLSAALSVVHNAGSVSVAGVYDTASKNPVFSPVLAAAPSGWTLSLNFTGGGLNEPTATAIDASGNVWVANYNNAVTELSPTGAAISPSTGYTGGGLMESFSIAIDSNGNAWVVNEQSGSVNSGRGSVTELSPTGAVLSGSDGYSAGGVYFPEAVAIDKSGNVWIANYGHSTLSELQGSSGASPGAALSLSSGDTGGGLSFPQAIATDDDGNVWLANTGANQLSEFSAAGKALSPSGGYTGGELNVPQAIAIDQNGTVWVANIDGSSVSVFNSAGAPLETNAISGGGLQGPGGIAIDGAGTAWVTNYRGASLSAFASLGASAGGAPLSPANSGFTGAGLDQPFSPAIDRSGNIWISNFANDSVTEFIGIAAPVSTPLIGTPQSP